MSDNPYAAPQTDSSPAAGSYHQVTSPYGPYRDLRMLRNIIVLLFTVWIALRVTIIILNQQALGFLSSARKFDQAEDKQIETINQLQGLNVNLTNAGIGLGLVTIAIIVFWCIWTNLSTRNAWLFGIADHSIRRGTGEVTPGWAVGSHFIPILNLWKPVEAVNFVRNKLGSGKPSGMLLAAWWGFWIMGILASQVARLYGREVSAFQNLEQQLRINSVLAGVIILAGISATLVAIKFTNAQHRRAKRMGIL